MARQRPDHLRLVSSTADPVFRPHRMQLTDAERAEIVAAVDAIYAEAAHPQARRDFTIGSLAQVKPWQRPTWRPFHGVVWRQPPSLLDRLQEWFRG